MPLLEPDGALDLPGLRVRSTAVTGQVDVVAVRGPGSARADTPDLDEQLADYRVPEQGARLLAAALAAQDVRPVLAVPLDELATTGSGGQGRGSDDGPALEIAVDAPGADEGQVVLEVDAMGVVAWHIAATSTGSDPGSRGDLEQVFRIPVRQLDVPGEPDDSVDRGLLGIGTRKLLQVLRYPIHGAAGAVARLLVSAWENEKRPYGVRMLDRTGSGADRSGTVPSGFALSADQLSAMNGKPALVLVHGTFSTAASGFHGLLQDAAFMAQLHDRYDGRVLEFDHPSLHVDPVANARWLLEQFPTDIDLVLDVVAHSRGGLVARALGSAGTAIGLSRGTPTLRTAIHVASPNAGTALADPDRWTTLLDTATNLAMLFPDDTVSVPLTGVIETVKQIGTGVLDGLDGLAAMAPGSPLLAQLAPAASEATPTRRYALASDFEPVSATVPIRALNVLVDAFFADGNDLVVPTAGVGQADAFSADETIVLPQTPAVSHSTYFRDESVRRQLLAWLPTGS